MGGTGLGIPGRGGRSGTVRQRAKVEVHRFSANLTEELRSGWRASARRGGERVGNTEREAHPEERPNVAVRASRVRSRMVFTLLDALCVFAGYGLAEVAYFRDRAPAHYWQHFLSSFC